MSWWHGFTRNWSDLLETRRDPLLKPVTIPLTPAEAVGAVADVARGLPRWEVESSDPAAGTLHLTHATLLWRFVDDVRLRFEPATGGGALMTGRSRSRVGVGDLGQNNRNLRELTAAVRRILVPGAQER